MDRKYKAHLHADMEFFGQFLNQLTEVDTAVSGVIENSFCSISLILNIVELHLKLQARCYLAASVKCVIFLTDGFKELLHVVDTCAALYFFQLRDRCVGLLTLALFLDEFAHHGHDTDVMTYGCLDCN